MFTKRKSTSVVIVGLALIFTYLSGGSSAPANAGCVNGICTADANGLVDMRVPLNNPPPFTFNPLVPVCIVISYAKLPGALSAIVTTICFFF